MLTRLVSLSILVAALAGAASAYTIVFRDGHRIEVPSVFTVTPTTFNFEAAPGINKTVQLVLIDVPSTERANGEAPGSFLKHGTRDVPLSGSPPARRAERTLTNRDLEPIKQRRIESEKEYEKRRLELGLPSIEETRRQQALAEESTLAFARQRAAAEASNEAYWRNRASELRNEILTVDAEINYVRGSLGPVRQFPLGTQSFVAGAFGRPFVGRNWGQTGAGRMGTVPASPSGLTNLGSRALRGSRPSAGFGFRGAAIGPSFGSPILPFGYGDNYYDRGEMTLRLNSLLVQRAGLAALWVELENQARIAGVPQVWLASY